MKYTNLQILKELKHIEKCHKSTPQNRNCMDISADCIYNENNSWILNYLTEIKYIKMNESQYSHRIVPFLSSYWKDFLKKKNRIQCFINDYQWWIITILWILITMITWILIYIFTNN